MNKVIEVYREFDILRRVYKFGLYCSEENGQSCIEVEVDRDLCESVARAIIKDDLNENKTLKETIKLKDEQINALREDLEKSNENLNKMLDLNNDLCGIITLVLLVASVIVFTDGNSAVGAILGGCAVGFAFGVGLLFQQAKERAEQIRAIKFFEGMQNALREMSKEMEAEEENRPFKEFDKDVPFPEVKEKKE